MKKDLFSDILPDRSWELKFITNLVRREKNHFDIEPTIQPWIKARTTMLYKKLMRTQKLFYISSL